MPLADTASHLWDSVTHKELGLSQALPEQDRKPNYLEAQKQTDSSRHHHAKIKQRGFLNGSKGGQGVLVLLLISFISHQLRFLYSLCENYCSVWDGCEEKMIQRWREIALSAASHA